MDMDYSNIFSPLPVFQYEIVWKPSVQIIDVVSPHNPWGIGEGNVILETINFVQPAQAQPIYQYQEEQEEDYTLFDLNLISPNIIYTNDQEMCPEAITTYSQPISLPLQLQPIVECDEINLIHNNEITALTATSPPAAMQDPSPPPPAAPQSNTANKKTKQQRKKPSKKIICTNMAPEPKKSGGHKDPLYLKKVEDAKDEKAKMRIEKATKCRDRRVKEKEIIKNFQLQNEELRKEIKLSIEEERFLEKKMALAHATNGIIECAVPPPVLMLISPLPQAVSSESKERTENMVRKDPPLYMTPVTKDTPEKERQRIEKSRRSHEYREKMKETTRQLEAEYGELHRSLKDSKTKVGILKTQLSHYQEIAAA